MRSRWTCVLGSIGLLTSCGGSTESDPSGPTSLGETTLIESESTQVSAPPETSSVDSVSPTSTMLVIQTVPSEEIPNDFFEIDPPDGLLDGNFEPVAPGDSLALPQGVCGKADWINWTIVQVDGEDFWGPTGLQSTEDAVLEAVAPDDEGPWELDLTCIRADGASWKPLNPSRPAISVE